MLTLLQTLVAGALRLPKRRVKAEHDDGMIVIELGESATGGLLLALALVVATLLRACCSRRDRSVAPLLFGILRAVVAADGVVKPEEERLLADVAHRAGLTAALRRRPATPEKTLHRMPGTAPRTKPCHTAFGSIISETGIAKPTVAAKKIRISHRMIRLSCVTHTWCERGTLTKHMPATKAPSRCEPMSEPR